MLRYNIILFCFLNLSLSLMAQSNKGLVLMPNASIAKDEITIPDKSPAFVIQYAAGVQQNRLFIANAKENQTLTLFNEDDNEAFFYGYKITPRNEGTTFLYFRSKWQLPSDTIKANNPNKNEPTQLLTTTQKNTSFVTGENNLAKGNFSIAIGENNTAKGDAAIAMGAFNTANQAGAIAMGFNTNASGDYSIALGQNNKAQGNSAFASGYKTIASGDYATTFGKNTLGKGDAAFAAGGFNEANGNFSISMGESNVSNGNFALSLGKENQANEPYTLAMGLKTKAQATSAISIGTATWATAFQEIAMGAYNTQVTAISTDKWNGNDRLFVIGNGTSEQQRADAFIMLKNGNATFTHNLTIQGTFSQPSDIRFKQQLTPFQSQGGSTLSQLHRLNAYRYYWRSEEFPDKHFSSHPQIGLLAQELENVYPELVITNEQGEKSIDYVKLTPILLEAIKELHTKVTKLEEEVRKNATNYQESK